MNSKENNKNEVVIWGTGKPKREFLYVEDIADAILFLMESVNAKDLYEKGISHINVGSGKDISINELADLISNIVGYKGKIVHDTNKPDGTPRKLLDVSRLTEKGWQAKINLEEGIRKVYRWYLGE